MFSNAFIIQFQSLNYSLFIFMFIHLKLRSIIIYATINFISIYFIIIIIISLNFIIIIKSINFKPTIIINFSVFINEIKFILFNFIKKIIINLTLDFN